MTIPLMFFKTKVKHFVHEIIEEYQIKHYDEVNFSDKSALSALLLDCYEDENWLEFITEANSKQTKKVIAGVLSYSYRADKTNEYIRDIAVDCFDRIIHELFDYCIQEHDEWLNS